MGSKSDALELALLDHVLGGPDWVRPATLYIALFTVAPTDAAGGTEVSGGAYARAAVASNDTNWPAAAAGSKSNGVAINFTTPTAPDWGEVVAFGIFDALAAGVLLYWGWLGSDAGKVFTAATSDTFTAPAHGLTDTQKVRIVAIPGGALPAGVSAGVTYFVRDAATDSFKLALTSGGTAIDITAAGAGLVATIAPKTISAGDPVSFAIGSLVISED